MYGTTRRRRRGGAGGPLVYDSFSRADSAVSMGNTEIGAKVWTPLAGVWGISALQAYLAVASAEAATAVDPGVANCTISMRLSAVPSAQGIVFRAQDAVNYWRVAFFLGSLYLQTNVAGVLSSFAGPIVLAPNLNDVLKVILLANSIIVQVNNIERYNVVSAQFQAATKHGLCQTSTGDITLRYDDFTIVL
jgi:hypothetical protein